jgi:8-oxo-dGTP pyrophosphatase MutT (NUDIX family)
VLLRNSSHNHNTWGLPGGNADEEDSGDLLVTAKREAIEEMTVCSASSCAVAVSPS